jgi:hypothetical protein
VVAKKNGPVTIHSCRASGFPLAYSACMAGCGACANQKRATPLHFHHWQRRVQNRATSPCLMGLQSLDLNTYFNNSVGISTTALSHPLVSSVFKFAVTTTAALVISYSLTIRRRNCLIPESYLTLALCGGAPCNLGHELICPTELISPFPAWPSAACLSF